MRAPLTLIAVSALYLVHLGVRALASVSAQGDASSAYVRRPLAHGAVSGLTNPKSYPVTLAIFTSVIAGNIGLLTADAVLVRLVGLPAVRRLYTRAALWITCGVAFLFFGFAACSLLHVVQPARPAGSATVPGDQHDAELQN